MWKPPLEVYVAWEPGFVKGAEIARSLLAWFTGDPDDPLSCGPGIPVSYRYLPAPREGGRLAVPWSRSRYSVLIVLVDDAMVARRDQWRGWLEDALAETEAGEQERRLLMCGLTRHFTNLSRKLSERQAVRITDLPEAFPALLMELRARIANEVCRLCDPERASEETTHLFISHAKRDGREAALRLKKYINQRPVGEVFFDEVDLQPSKAFDEGFRKTLSRATLVVLMTDTWASRYWCQWEALQGKELERPMLLVDMLSEGERRHFPYLGNIPTVRCEAGDLKDADCRRIVAAAQLETLRDIHEKLRMEALEHAGRLPSGAHHLTRAPELATLVTLLAADDENGRQAEAMAPSRHVFIYPDPPVAQHERRLIRRFSPSMQMATPIELLGGEGGPRDLEGRVVAISLSNSPNLDELGYEQAHLDRLWVALSQHLLGLGSGVAYGGDLREGGYTEILLHLIGAYADQGRLLDERLVQWHVAWPISLRLTDEIRATLPDVIDLRTVGKPADVQADEHLFVKPQEDPYAWIRSLTEMRREMVATTDARVLIGGQRMASTPRSGIAEEFILSLRAGQPLYLCGAYGGMTDDIIRVLQGREVPESLTDPGQLATTESRQAAEAYNRSEQGARDPIDYARLVKEIAAAGVVGLRNGLTQEENERLFETPSVEEIVGLVRKGLLACAADRGVDRASD